MWDSGVGLSSWLVELAHQSVRRDEEHPLVVRAREALFSSTKCSVIELGELEMNLSREYY